MKNLSSSKTHFQYQAELAGSFGRNPQIGMLNLTGNHYTEPDLNSNDAKSKDPLCFLSSDRRSGHEFLDRPSFDHRSSENTGTRCSVIENPHFRVESGLESDVSARDSATSEKRQRDSINYKNDMKNVSKLLENISKDLHEAKLDMQLRKFSRNSEEQKDSAVSTVLPSQTEVDSIKLSSPENKRLSSKKSFSSAQEIPSQSEIDNDLISKIDTDRQNTEKRLTARNPSPPGDDYLRFNECRHTRGSKSSIPDLQQIYSINFPPANRTNNVYQKSATTSNFFTTFKQDQYDRKDYNELNEMLQQEKNRNGKLENKLQDMEALLEQMRVFHGKLYQNYVETKDELQAGKTGFLSTIVQENNQNEKLKVKLDDLQKLNQTLIEENKHLKESNKKKTDVIGKLEDQVKATKSELAILKEKHQNKVESLMIKIKKLEKENLENIQVRENSRGNTTYRKDLRVETEGFSDRSKEYMRHDFKGLNETFVDSERKSRNSEIPEAVLHTHRELAKCKEEAESVKRENRKLRLELQSLSYARKSCDLREALQQVENVAQNLKSQVSENKKLPNPNTMYKTLTDISIEIEVENMSAILPKIKEIQEENKTNKKFVDSFLDLVFKCSPSGKFEKKPTVKQGWKWMKRLMEEYMEMRREGKNDTLRETDLIKKLAAYLGVKNKEDLLGKIKDLINENGLMNKIISKIKSLYHIEWSAPIQELERRLELMMNSSGSSGRMNNKLETRGLNLTQKIDNK